MKTSPIQPLDGMKDSFEAEYSTNKRINQVLGDYLAQFGYRFVDPPLLEKTELFLRKSGGEFGSRLYSFTDPGGNKVSLRPEFTSSIIRMFVQSQKNLTLPIRWQYAGPVFRYNPIKTNQSRQFSQVGAELIGSSDLAIDAELISIAWKGLSCLNINNHVLNIGHMGIINMVLNKLDLTDRGRGFLIRSIPWLKNNVQSSEILRKAKDQLFLSPKYNLKADLDIDNINPQSLKPIIQSLFDKGTYSAVGQRTSKEIIERFIKRIKQNDNLENIEMGIKVLTKLVKIKGESTQALSDARSISDEFKMDTNIFDNIGRLVQLLCESGINKTNLNIDFGLVRGISYYTGVIFDIGHPALPSENSLGGGGRYDSLVESLGGIKDTPALGFAYNLDWINMLLLTGDKLIDQNDKE